MWSARWSHGLPLGTTTLIATWIARAPKIAGAYRRWTRPRAERLPPAGRTVATARMTTASSNTGGLPPDLRAQISVVRSGIGLYGPALMRIPAPGSRLGAELPKSRLQSANRAHRRDLPAMKTRLVRIAFSVATLASVAMVVGAPGKFH